MSASFGLSPLGDSTRAQLLWGPVNWGSAAVGQLGRLGDESKDLMGGFRVGRGEGMRTGGGVSRRIDKYRDEVPITSTFISFQL